MSALYSTAVLADGPIAYWRLNDRANSLVAVDSSGGGHNGVLSGGVTPGKPGLLTEDPATSMQFDGTGQIALAPIPRPAVWTVEAWTKPVGNSMIGSNPVLSLKGFGDNYNPVFEIFSHALSCGFQGVGTFYGTVVVDDGSRHYIAWTYDGNLLSLCVDGVLDTAYVIGALPARQVSGYTTIGGNPAAYTFFAQGGQPGLLEELAIYAYSFPSAQIASRYRLGVSPTGILFPVRSRLAKVLPYSQSPQGNWIGAYGSRGYALFSFWNPTPSGDVIWMPGVSIGLDNGARYTWSQPDTTGARVLSSPDGSFRAAGCWYDGSSLQFHLAFTSDYQGVLSLYILDWDAISRRERVTITDSIGVQEAVITTNMGGGVWIHAPISVRAGGRVAVSGALLGGVNIVVSGVFLD